jgi:hypothetical protein
LEGLFSLCNSGIRSDQAIYKNDPAAKGSKKCVILPIYQLSKSAKIHPINALNAVKKFTNNAFFLLNHP